MGVGVIFIAALKRVGGNYGVGRLAVLEVGFGGEEHGEDCSGVLGCAAASDFDVSAMLADDAF